MTTKEDSKSAGVQPDPIAVRATEIQEEQTAAKRKGTNTVDVTFLGHFDPGEGTKYIRTEEGDFGIGSSFAIEKEALARLQGSGYNFDTSNKN